MDSYTNENLYFIISTCLREIILRIRINLMIIYRIHARMSNHYLAAANLIRTVHHCKNAMYPLRHLSNQQTFFLKVDMKHRCMRADWYKQKLSYLNSSQSYFNHQYYWNKSASFCNIQFHCLHYFLSQALNKLTYWNYWSCINLQANLF